MCVQFSVDLTCVSVYISVYICMLHISVHMYVLVCVCVHQGVHICVTVSMCRRGVGVICVLCVEGPGCSPDFSWELQWSMSSAENSKSKPLTS